MDDQEDDSPEPAPLPNALNTVRLLISYIEEQDATKTPFLRSLERFERDLESEMIVSRAQGTLDNWLNNI